MARRTRPRRYPWPPLDNLARFGWDRAAYRRALPVELRAAMVDFHRLDRPGVRDDADPLDERWHRALLRLDRLVAQGRHELLVIAEEEGQLDLDALDWMAPFPGRDELAALPPSPNPAARALRELLDAEELLERRSMKRGIRALERLARDAAGRRREADLEGSRAR